MNDLQGTPGFIKNCLVVKIVATLQEATIQYINPTSTVSSPTELKTMGNHKCCY